MTNPKRKLRGLPDLGQALDERHKSQTKQLDVRHDTGSATPAPVASGIAAGGGGGSAEPALPESFVTGLKEAQAADILTGELQLAASGDTVISQSSQAPHFTISSPEYSASDGVERNHAEFSCDASVVRTSGAQTVGGVKSFSEFPLTPAAAPAANYQCANKQYVDAAAHFEQVFACASAGTANPQLLLHHEAGIFPSTAVAAAYVTAMGCAACSLPGSAGMGSLHTSFGRWTWTGALAGSDLTQSQVLLGVPLRKWANKLRLRVRFRLNNSARLEGLYLGLNDANNTDTLINSSQCSLALSGAHDALWVEAQSGAIDLSGWNSALRATLTAQGAQDANAGLTQFDVEWLAIEQWA